MASDVTGGDSPPAAEPTPAEPPVLPEPRETPHRWRFLGLYGVLGIALGAAAAGLVISLNTKLVTGAGWSSWRPTGGGLGAAGQIAEHVGGEYRLPSGIQMDDVISKAPSVTVSKTTIPVAYLAVRGSHGAVDQLFQVSGANTVMFTLCGLGPACTISTGKPSVARGRLVRREILELALYTFHYDGGIDGVLGLMPPSGTNKAPAVVYLQRGDLTPELREPLDRTLAPNAPLPATMSLREKQVVESNTGARVYSFSLTQAQDGGAILILNPLAA